MSTISIKENFNIAHGDFQLKLATLERRSRTHDPRTDALCRTHLQSLNEIQGRMSAALRGMDEESRERFSIRFQNCSQELKKCNLQAAEEGEAEEKEPGVRHESATPCLPPSHFALDVEDDGGPPSRPSPSSLSSPPCAINIAMSFLPKYPFPVGEAMKALPKTLAPVSKAFCKGESTLARDMASSVKTEIKAIVTYVEKQLSHLTKEQKEAFCNELTTLLDSQLQIILRTRPLIHENMGALKWDFRLPLVKPLTQLFNQLEKSQIEKLQTAFLTKNYRPYFPHLGRTLRHALAHCAFTHSPLPEADLQRVKVYLDNGNPEAALFIARNSRAASLAATDKLFFAMFGAEIIDKLFQEIFRWHLQNNGLGEILAICAEETYRMCSRETQDSLKRGLSIPFTPLPLPPIRQKISCFVPLSYLSSLITDYMDSVLDSSDIQQMLAFLSENVKIGAQILFFLAKMHPNAFIPELPSIITIIERETQSPTMHSMAIILPIIIEKSTIEWEIHAYTVVLQFLYRDLRGTDPALGLLMAQKTQDPVCQVLALAHIMDNDDMSLDARASIHHIISQLSVDTVIEILLTLDIPEEQKTAFLTYIEKHFH